MGNAILKSFIAVCALVTPTAWGQVSPKTPAKAMEPLGRLFFTPAQRASLDIARVQKLKSTISTDNTEQSAPAAQTITYGGIVRRSDGKSTLWLNNRPVHDQEPVGGISIVGRIGADGSVTLQVPQSGRSVNLKPGQSIELLSGTIEEGFSRKPVQPEPKPAAKSATEAKPAAKSAIPERAADERDREDRERRIDEAARVLRDTTNKPAAVPPPEGPAR